MSSSLHLYPGGRLDRLMALSDPQALFDMAVPEAVFAMLPDPLEEPGAIDPTTVVGPVAVIDVRGVLSKWPSWWRWFGVGSATLPEIESAVRRATADPRIETILIRASSPGGTVPGTESCADAIFEARSAKRTVMFAEDLSASAAYWIGCQAEEIVTHATGEVGSIGVFTAIADVSKWLKSEGVSVFLASSGGIKGHGTWGVPLSDEFKAHISEQIEAYAQLFDAAVARGRGIELTVARQLRDGRTHLAAGALEVGLVDRIQSFESLLAELTGEDTTQVPVPATDPDDDDQDEEQAKEDSMPKRVEGESPPAATSTDEVKALADEQAKGIEALREQQQELKAQQAALAREQAQFAVTQKLNAMGSKLTPAMKKGGHSDVGTLAAALTELQVSGLEMAVKAKDDQTQTVAVADVVLAALSAAAPLAALEEGEMATSDATGDERPAATTTEAAIYAEMGLDDDRIKALEKKFGVGTTDPN